MEKSKRGNFDYATDAKSGLTVVHWHDNNIIMQHSFKQGKVAPPQIAKRWSRAETKRMETTQPFMAKHYNQTMGGVARWSKMWTSTASPSIQRSGGGHCLLSVWMSVSSRHSTCTGQHQQLRPNHWIFLPFRHSIARVYLARATQTTSFGRQRGSSLAVNKRVFPEV